MAILETKAADNNIVHNHIIGDLTISELVDMVIEYNKAPSVSTIWDLTEAFPVEFNPFEMMHGIDQAAPHVRQNPGRRTAWLGTTPLSFGTTRMLLSWSDRAAPEIEFQAFNDFSEAISWLNE